MSDIINEEFVPGWFEIPNAKKPHYLTKTKCLGGQESLCRKWGHGGDDCYRITTGLDRFCGINKACKPCLVKFNAMVKKSEGEA